MNFSDIKTLTLANPTREHVADLRKATFHKSKELLWKSIPATGLLPWQYDLLDDLLGFRPRSMLPLASNMNVMSHLHAALGDNMSDAWEETQQRQMWLLTFTPNSWLLDEHRPVINLRRAKGDVQNWLKALQFTGLAIFELAPFLNHPAMQDGRMIRG